MSIKPKTQAMFVLTSFIGLLERYQPPRGNAARFNLRCQ